MTRTEETGYCIKVLGETVQPLEWFERNRDVLERRVFKMYARDELQPLDDILHRMGWEIVRCRRSLEELPALAEAPLLKERA